MSANLVNVFDENIAQLMNALNFAAIKHKNQRRKDPEKTPYINHPIGVANLLVSVGRITNLNVLIAAILHDTVEDTDTNLQEIETNFGKEVRNIVAEVTDDKSLPKEERKRLQIIHSSSLSVNAKLIKLADKLYNLRDLLRATPEGWSEERIQEYFNWSSKVINGILGSNEFLEKELRDVLAVRNVFIVQ